MKPSLKRLDSLPLVIIFTGAGFIILAASVILMSVESLISHLLLQVRSQKTQTGEKSLLKAQQLSREAKVCSRT